MDFQEASNLAAKAASWDSTARKLYTEAREPEDKSSALRFVDRAAKVYIEAGEALKELLQLRQRGLDDDAVDTGLKRMRMRALLADELFWEKLQWKKGDELVKRGRDLELFSQSVHFDVPFGSFRCTSFCTTASPHISVDRTVEKGFSARDQTFLRPPLSRDLNEMKAAIAAVKKASDTKSKPRHIAHSAVTIDRLRSMVYPGQC